MQFVFGQSHLVAAGINNPWSKQAVWALLQMSYSFSPCCSYISYLKMGCWTPVVFPYGFFFHICSPYLYANSQILNEKSLVHLLSRLHIPYLMETRSKTGTCGNRCNTINI